MSLIKSEVVKIFNQDAIAEGDLVYAVHRSWDGQGKCGFVSKMSGTQIMVQYFNKMGNGTNHFVIPVSEVEKDEWDIRWSKDLLHVVSEGESNETE